jgi:hypothetical protein
MAASSSSGRSRRSASCSPAASGSRPAGGGHAARVAEATREAAGRCLHHAICGRRPPHPPRSSGRRGRRLEARAGPPPPLPPPPAARPGQGSRTSHTRPAAGATASGGTGCPARRGGCLRRHTAKSVQEPFSRPVCLAAAAKPASSPGRRSTRPRIAAGSRLLPRARGDCMPPAAAPAVMRVLAGSRHHPCGG